MLRIKNYLSKTHNKIYFGIICCHCSKHTKNLCLSITTAMQCTVAVLGTANKLIITLSCHGKKVFILGPMYLPLGDKQEKQKKFL